MTTRSNYHTRTRLSMIIVFAICGIVIFAALSH